MKSNSSLSLPPLPSPIAAWTAFAAMTTEDDATDAGPNIKLIGRWSDLAGGNGICIVECADPADVMAWGANWAGLDKLSAAVDP
jgi:hypothetical protein